jgi:hypothetical protein
VRRRTSGSEGLVGGGFVGIDKEGEIVSLPRNRLASLEG